MTIEANNVGHAMKKGYIRAVVAALEAGVDVADFPIGRIPCTAEIIGAYILPQGDDSGIDGSNTSAWLIKVGSTTIASKTYSNTVAFPNAGVASVLTLTTTLANRLRVEDEVLTVSVTNGSTAATPAAIVEVEYMIADGSIFDTAHDPNYCT